MSNKDSELAEILIIYSEQLYNRLQEKPLSDIELKQRRQIAHDLAVYVQDRMYEKSITVEALANQIEIHPRVILSLLSCKLPTSIIKTSFLESLASSLDVPLDDLKMIMNQKRPHSCLSDTPYS